jgi:hypothetical protein
MQLLRLNGIMRTAVRLIRGLNLELDGPQFSFGVFSVISWFKVRWEGSATPMHLDHAALCHLWMGAPPRARSVQCLPHPPWCSACRRGLHTMRPNSTLDLNLDSSLNWTVCMVQVIERFELGGPSASHKRRDLRRGEGCTQAAGAACSRTQDGCRCPGSLHKHACVCFA